MILACLLPIVKQKDWSGTWGIKGIKLGRRDQYILEDLFCYERRRMKSTDMECKLQQIPEEFRQKGGNIMWKFISRMRALPSLSDGMVRELIHAEP